MTRPATGDLSFDASNSRVWYKKTSPSRFNHVVAERQELSSAGTLHRQHAFGVANVKRPDTSPILIDSQKAETKTLM